MIVAYEFFDKDTKENLNYTVSDRLSAILGDWKERNKEDDIKKYQRYLDRFNPDCKNKIVLDIGCGAWGGILPLIEAEKKIAIDSLIRGFKELGIFDYDGEYLDNNAEQINLPDNYADVVFCLNTLDHCFDVETPPRIIKEILRILKIGGLLYIHTHLRNSEQLNLMHFYGIEEKDLNRWITDFKKIRWEICDNDYVWERPYNTFWGILEK